VTEYRIKFKASNNLYYEAPSAACHSSAVATVTCTMLMSVLTASPFSLGVGASIIAQVEAKNGAVGGYSVPSADSTSSVTVRTPPTVAPTLSKDPSTSETAVVLVWTTTTTSTSPGNGGSAVTSYTVYHDSQIAGNIVCTVIAPTVTCTPTQTFAAGTTYSYLITATNAYGEGVASTPLFSVQTSTVPDAIATAPTVVASGAAV
jgi:hypothetical protein